jgi:hypothetical protein
VDHNRAAVYGSTVDHGRRQPKRSPECELGGHSGEWKLAGGGEKGEETFGILTGGKWGRCDDGGAPTTTSGSDGAWSSVGGQHGRGVERIDARARTAVWRRCSRMAFIGRGTTGGGRSRSNQRRLGGTSMAKPFRVGRKWGGETGSRGRGTAAPIHFAAGEEGSSGRWERVGEVLAAAPGQASRGRRRPGSLTGWAHQSARDGRIGQVL